MSKEQLEKEKDFIILRASNYHYDLGVEHERERISDLINEEIKEAEDKHKEHFKKEIITEVGYHSKVWKVPKWLLSGIREGTLKELKSKIGKNK